jgi:hypothetical protein
VCAGYTKRCHTHHITAVHKTKDTPDNVLCRRVRPREQPTLSNHECKLAYADCLGQVVDSYSGGFGFEYRSENRILAVLLSYSRRRLEYLAAALRALGSTQPLTEMSTGNIKKLMFLGTKVRLVRGADNLTAIYEPSSRQCGILNISQPYRPPRPVTGIALLSTFTRTLLWVKEG